MADEWGAFQPVEVGRGAAAAPVAKPAVADAWSSFAPVAIGKPGEARPVAPAPAAAASGPELPLPADPARAALAAAMRQNPGQPSAPEAGGANAAGEGRSGAVSTLSGIPIAGAYVPQVAAALNAAAQPVIGAPGMSEAPTYAQRYAENLPKIQAGTHQFEAEHPVVSTGAKIVTGTAALAPLGASAPIARVMGMTGGSLPSMAARSATSGAAIGGADALARGENPLTGIEVGAVTGAAGPYVGRAIGAAYQGARNLISRPSIPENIVNVGGTPVRVTGGQAAQDFEAIAREQDALRGGMGAPAQRVADRFQGEQAADLNRARENITRGMEPYGQVMAETPQAAAEAVGEAIPRAAQQLRQLRGQAYDRVAATPGEFDPAAFQQIGTSIRTRLNAGADPVRIDARTTPNAADAIHDIETNVGGLNFQNMVGPGHQPPNAAPITLQTIDEARKRLITLQRQTLTTARATGDQSDVRAMRRVIGAFDDHVRDALQPGTFTGNAQAAQTALDEARALHAQYRRTFTSQGAGDQVGQIVQKIIGRHEGQEAQPAQIAQWLYGGANQTGSSSIPVQVAQRVRTILGPDSAEWNGVRQGMFARLLQPAEGATEWGPARISNQIANFLNGNGNALSQVLFTPAERQAIRQYGEALRMTVPPAGATNPSGTSFALQRMSQGALKHVMAALGFGATGPVGAIAGYGLAAAGKAASNRATANEVARSLYNGPGRAAADEMQRARLARLTAAIARGAQPELVPSR